MLFWIIIIIIVLVYMKLESNAMYITSKFRFGNVILFGKKRKGKDLIFQKVIYSRRRSDYYANIPYGYKHNEIALSEISLKPNTYHDLINGKIHKLIKKGVLKIADNQEIRKLSKKLL